MLPILSGRESLTVWNSSKKILNRHSMHHPVNLVSVSKDFQEIDRAHLVRKFVEELFHDGFDSETALQNKICLTKK